jgi:hypothetical protein
MIKGMTMATTNKTQKHQENEAKAAADAAESTGKAAMGNAEHTARAARDSAEEAVGTVSDATKRATVASARTAEAVTGKAAEAIDPEAIASTARESIGLATESQQQALETIGRTGTSMLAGLGEVQREIADFVAARIRQDLETQREFLTCRTFDEVREVQSRYLRSTMDHYSEEVRRLIQLGSDTLMRSVEHPAS